MTTRRRLPALLTLLALALAPAASAQTPAASLQRGVSESLVPAPVAYTGLLTDEAGVPLEGVRRFVFRLYATPEAVGAPVWEQASDVALVGGQFTAFLGAERPMPATGDGPWLTVSIDDGSESEPVPLSSLDAPAAAARAGAPSLQDAYLGGNVINATGGAVRINGTGGVILSLNNGDAQFISDDQASFRLRSRNAARTYALTVHGTTSLFAPLGTFTIRDLTGGANVFSVAPGSQDGLLVLDGNTVEMGTTDATADLDIWTTAGATKTFEIDDVGGHGAEMLLYAEDGSRNFAFQPDANGTGGYFTVYRNGFDDVGFRVDGNYSNTNNTRVEIEGTSPSHFLTDQTGSASVVLPTNAIEASEVLDEAGVANVNSVYFKDVNRSTTLLSRTLTCPAAGFVLGLGTTQITLAPGESLDLGLNDTAGSIPSNQNFDFGYPAGNSTSTSDILLSGSVHGVFPCTAGESKTIYLIGAETSGTGIRAGERQLTALYVPTSYGTVTGSIEDPNTKLNSGVDDDSAPVSAGLTTADVTAERVASIEANVARMQRENDELRALVRELQAEGGNDG